MPSAPIQGDPAPLDGALSAAALEGLSQRKFSIYLHVPFCVARCGYCDFNTYTAAELGSAPGSGQDAYLRAVVAELDLARRTLIDPPAVQTVFFGGGTPTILSAATLTGVLSAITDRFDLAPNAEVTTEANPESLDRRYLDALVEGGFNRLSLGMQSARPGVLAVLERRHTPGRVAEVVDWARGAGFESISLDLIYANPGESAQDWRASLDAALALAPEHLSAYSLIVEPGTRLAARIARGELNRPDPDTQADYYLMAEELLSGAGYANYEISNWALPGKECRHNLAYWHGDDWWGIGPGAHSHLGGVRWWNLRHPGNYSSRLSNGRSPAEAREVLTAEERHLEVVMLQLRLSEGIALQQLTATEIARAEPYLAAGLVEITQARMRLTKPGRLLADGVIRDLLS